MRALSSLPTWAISLVVSLLMSVLTQIASNVTSASMLLPVLKDLSIALRINPLYLMLPPTVVSSFAFMLPVSTGPNALAYIPSKLETLEFAKVSN